MTSPQFNINYKFGGDLREIPEDPASMQAYLDYLLTEIKKLKNDQPRLMVRLLGEVGSYARILGKIEAAHQALEKSLSLIDEHQMDLSTWAVHSLRYGEVLRCKKDELGAETAFRSVLEMSQRQQGLRDLTDFALQHLGKLRFDQKRWDEASEFFKQTLAIRKRKNIPELIRSTELALRVTEMTRDRK